MIREICWSDIWKRKDYQHVVSKIYVYTENIIGEWEGECLQLHKVADEDPDLG